ncbi:MAG: hypothetical protein NUV82_02130 [Candidatus Komeilibacteria bacterium]|nr:hypothetical protein [Candidatus Komeilibacteria bacterium]
MSGVMPTSTEKVLKPEVVETVKSCFIPEKFHFEIDGNRIIVKEPGTTNQLALDARHIEKIVRR